MSSRRCCSGICRGDASVWFGEVMGLLRAGSRQQQRLTRCDAALARTRCVPLIPACTALQPGCVSGFDAQCQAMYDVQLRSDMLTRAMKQCRKGQLLAMRARQASVSSSWLLMFGWCCGHGTGSTPVFTSGQCALRLPSRCLLFASQPLLQLRRPPLLRVFGVQGHRSSSGCVQVLWWV